MFGDTVLNGGWVFVVIAVSDLLMGLSEDRVSNQRLHTKSAFA